MKTVAFLSLFGVATLAHPAGLWWGTDTCYTSPENTDNQCSDVQEIGFDFDWSELADDDDWGYDGFDFVGFNPKNDCGGSTGGDCIGGTLSRYDDWTLKVDATDAPFSVRNFHLSTSRQTDVHLTYKTPNGHSCHQVVSSSPEGVDVENDQCGGAVSVEFKLPEQSKFGECELDVHQIDFDCSAGEKPPHPVASHSHSYPEPTPSSTTIHSHSYPEPTPSSTTIHSHSYPEPTPSSTTIHSHSYPEPTPSSTTIHSHSHPEPTRSSTTTRVSSHMATSSAPDISFPTRTPQVTTSTAWTTDELLVTSCAPTVSQCPAHSTVVVTSTYVLSTTVCPYKSTETGHLHSLGLETTSTGVSHKSSHVSVPNLPPRVTSKTGEPSAVVTSSEPIPSSPSTHAPCPELVPKCINTWLSIPKCDSNSDAACFCPSSEFTGKVTSCIHAWGKSDQEIQSGLSYFAGICAPYVPKNPAIVDIVPTSTPHRPATKTSIPSQVASTTPVEHVKEITRAPHTPCTTITWSSHTVTVPQVGFSTVTGSSSTNVNLVLITPTATEWSHTSHSSPPLTMTTKSKTTTSSVYTTTVSKPTETFVVSNTGSRSGLESLWAFGVAILALSLY